MSEKLKELAEKLPDWIPSYDSNNEDLLGAAADEIVRFEQDRNDVFKATKVQLAETSDEIEEHSKLVDVDRTGDSTPLLRSKTLVGFALNASQGTVPQTLNQMATILDTDVEEIEYEEIKDERGVTRYWILESTMEEHPMEPQEFIDTFTEFVAAGYEVDIFLRSTFEHKTVEEYNNDVMEPERGYNGLDADGNVKENGGEYSGLLKF